VGAAVRTHRELALENLALRQQLAVWKVRRPRPLAPAGFRRYAPTGAGGPVASDPPPHARQLTLGNVLASVAGLPGSSIKLLEDTSTVHAAVSPPWCHHTRLSRTSPARAPGASFRGPAPGPSS